jgi:hypothetical protein
MNHEYHPTPTPTVMYAHTTTLPTDDCLHDHPGGDHCPTPPLTNSDDHPAPPLPVLPPPPLMYEIVE